MTHDELQAIKARAAAAQAARDLMNGFTCDPSDLRALAQIDAAIGSILQSQKDLSTLVSEVERLRGILKQIDSLYNRDRVAQPMAHQIEKLFDSVDDYQPVEG